MINYLKEIVERNQLDVEEIEQLEKLMSQALDKTTEKLTEKLYYYTDLSAFDKVKEIAEELEDVKNLKCYDYNAPEDKVKENITNIAGKFEKGIKGIFSK